MLITWIGRDAGPSGKLITKEKGNLALNKGKRCLRTLGPVP